MSDTIVSRNGQNSSTSWYKSSNFWSPAMLIFGIIGVTGVFISQFFAVQNGSSGQITIQNNINLILVPVLTFITIIAMGFFLYEYVNKSSTPYLIIFLVAMGSYLVSNMAFMFSLFQVKVSA